ncbi:rifin PIR protein, putative [Plasmodium sp. gorilla clade G2]|uniref:rifin PIR protein, putative n=1 Tax=Plasmodium sp. gorilla clade G2 TaxID=880535 RepID=UPI000D2994E0|nr:rifin PIR protein, putative [Plasmodium sp. gorilla clade G2]SOV20424.1 rifin PIR protein, putative [Plasmodium sp. gorilla clade G2]
MQRIKRTFTLHHIHKNLNQQNHIEYCTNQIKLKKTCLKCGGILGSTLPELGFLGKSALYGKAVKRSTDAAFEEGIASVLYELKEITVIDIL